MQPSIAIPAQQQPDTRNDNGSASIFHKCSNNRFVQQAKHYTEANIYPYFREISSGQDTEVIIEGQRLIMLGSNSYLGLTNHPAVIEASEEALRKYGTGNAGSRYLNGTLDIHRMLEEELADFMGYDAALLFGTGYQTNVGVISALVGPHDYIILDAAAHACMLDGARLCMGKTVKYAHNNMASLEEKLRLLPRDSGKMIAAEGIFSMEGDKAPLDDIIRLAERYNAGVMVDDAHATGVIGRMGRGSGDHFGLTQKQIDMVTLTFSKTLSALGGAVVGKNDTIYYLRHNSRALIYSASIPAPTVAAVRKSLEIMRSEPNLIETLWDNLEYMHDGLRHLGFQVPELESAIIPLPLGEMETTFRFWKRVTELGIFVNPVLPPAVPHETCMIRMSFMASHTRDQLDRSLEILKRAGEEFGLI